MLNPNQIENNNKNLILSRLNFDHSNEPRSSNFNNKKPKLTFYFGKCKVCKDKATGIHYGIPTCESCKVFFKRGIQDHGKFKCLVEFKCEITPKMRKKCRYCRWQACINAGMSIEAIKMGRIPKIEKEKSHLNALKEVEKTNSQLSCRTNLSLSEQSFLSLQRDKCYQVYMKYNENIRKLYDYINKLIMKGLGDSLISDSLMIPLRNASEMVMFKLEGDIKNFILYAKELPGFDSLSSVDFRQVVTDKVFMTIFLKLSKMPLMQVMFGEKLTHDLCSFFNKFNSLGLTDYELAAYIPYVLTIPNNEPYENLDLLVELNEFYSQILMYEMSLNNRKSDFIYQIQEIYTLLPSINEMTKNLSF